MVELRRRAARSFGWFSALVALVLAWSLSSAAVPSAVPVAKAATDYRLLIADNLNKRLLITDFNGNIKWVFNNPLGTSDWSAGPLGVRWMPNNKILATFGTGVVAQIDEPTKTFDWKFYGCGGDWLQSPYDAEILPDGNLAVATRYNQGGRITVYNRQTCTVVWQYLLSNAHSVHYRPAGLGYGTSYPTLLVGGWGNVKEVIYNPPQGPAVSWSVQTQYTHDAIVVENNDVLTSEGYFIQKIDRQGNQIWVQQTPDEERRIAINPNGGYIFTVANGDRVEFRDINGNVTYEWSYLSDGTHLDLPYGIQVLSDFVDPAPTPTPPASGTVFSDNFESGTWNNWTLVHTGGDGTATVQSSVVKSGSFAGELTATSNTGSFAFAQTNLGLVRSDVDVNADVRVDQEGASGSNVRIFNLLTSTGGLVASLYRQNATGGQLWVQAGGTYTKTSASLPLTTWGNLDFHVTVNAGALSPVVVKLNGATILNTSLNLGGTGVFSLQLGTDTLQQTNTSYFDNVVVTSGSSPSPSPTPTPTASPSSSATPTPMPSPTPTSTPVPTPTPTPTASPSPTPVPTPTPTPTPSAGALFSDGFESGNFSAWTTVAAANGGVATVQSSVVRTGSFAAQLAETNTSGSYAYARTTLPSPQTALTVAGDFRVDQEGATGGNVPLFRLFTSGGVRVVAFYRQNATGGQLWLQYGGAYNSTTGTLPLGTWGHVQLQVVINGTSSTVKAWLNGMLIHSNTAANLGSTAIASVQIGNDTPGQTFLLYADNISVTTP